MWATVRTLRRTFLTLVSCPDTSSSFLIPSANYSRLKTLPATAACSGSSQARALMLATCWTAPLWQRAIASSTMRMARASLLASKGRFFEAKRSRWYDGKIDWLIGPIWHVTIRTTGELVYCGPGPVEIVGSPAPF